MDNYTATELAYNNGYEQGKKDAVMHGRWVVWTEKFLGVFCSECHKLADNKFNYCPNCGAKMDGGDPDA